ncbi:MAG: hypothetical protein ACOY3P_13325 [Planctomycetota bacterium]
MKSLVLLGVLPVVVVIGNPGGGAAFAQPISTHYNSLEWLVADSDVVVRASVAEMADGVGADGVRWKLVTLTAHEQLKGKAVEPCTFAVESAQDDRTYEGWKDSDGDQIWFLKRNPLHRSTGASKRQRIESRYPLRPYGGAWTAIPLGEDEADRPDRSTLNRLPVYTMDGLRVLRTGSQTLRAARAAASVDERGSSLRRHSIVFPTSLDNVTVPVDSRLEKLALRLIRSPEEFFPEQLRARPESDENMRSWKRARQGFASCLRAEGVKAIVYFKSDEHICLLRGLLDDPAYRLVTMAGDDKPVSVQRQFFLRHEVATVLCGWGVRFAMPALAEWIPQDRVFRREELPAQGDRVDKPNSSIAYYFTNRFRLGSDADTSAPPGLYRSEDDGRTWRLWSNEFEFEEVYMHPGTGTLYAAVEHSRLVKDGEGFLQSQAGTMKALTSLDGKKWRDITPGGDCVPGILRFMVDPDHPRQVCLYIGFCTGASSAGNEAFCLQATDDEYRKWKWYQTADFVRRNEVPPLRIE